MTRTSFQIRCGGFLVVAWAANNAAAQSAPQPPAPQPPEASNPPAAASLAAPPPSKAESPSQAQEADPASREYSRQRLNSLTGTTGLLHTVAADSGAPGTFRLSYTESYYHSKGFLCPTPAACGLKSAAASEDTLSRTTQDIGLSATLTPYLEGTLGLHNQALSDNFASPSVVQAIGDVWLGAKVFTPHDERRLYSVGGIGQLRFLGGSGNIGLHTANFMLGALGTLDLRHQADPAARIPIRIHTNIGYLFDNSGSIATSTEESRHRPITRIERLGMGINRVDSVLLGLGTEYVTPYVQPFAEWTVDITANRQHYICNTTTVGAGDACLVRSPKWAGAPSRLTLGMRIAPIYEGLSATVAFDIGTSATSRFVEERSPELPWNLYLALGYAFDTYHAPPVVTVAAPPKVVQIRRPQQYRLVGKVLDEASSAPIAHARIEFETATLTGLVSKADGSFDISDVPPGYYKLSVSAPGYKDGTCDTTIERDVKAEQATTDQPVITSSPVRCALKALPPLGTVRGQVIDAESGVPLEGVQFQVRDQRERKVDMQSDGAGKFTIEHIPAGALRISLSKPGYLPNALSTKVEKDQEALLTLVLRKTPKQLNVTVGPKELKLKTPIRFSGNELDATARALLQEVAQVLTTHPELQTIAIQSHVDDSGRPDFDLKLSNDNATQVREQLVALGVAPERLVVAAQGSADPIAPNNSDANRAKNRRIRFLITSRK